MNNLDAFTKAYLTAALWTDDPDPQSGEFCEHDYWTIDNISPDSIQRAIADCADFQGANRDDLDAIGVDEETDSRNGTDFWLTRNGHGTGFWDRGYGAVGERLTRASNVYGSVDVRGPEVEDNGASTPDQLAAWDKVIHID